MGDQVKQIGNAIKLGSKVKDPITGFTGIAIVRSVWLFGCSRIGVQPQEVKDGKPVEECWFDEVRLEVVEGPALDQEKPFRNIASALQPLLAELEEQVRVLKSKSVDQLSDHLHQEVSTGGPRREGARAIEG